MTDTSLHMNTHTHQTTPADSFHVHIHVHMQTRTRFYLIEPDSLLQYTCYLWAPGGGRVKGEGFKLNAKTPEVCTSSELHWPEKLFINTWPGWTECPCKRRKGDLLCVNKTLWNCRIQTDRPKCIALALNSLHLILCIYSIFIHTLGYQFSYLHFSTCSLIGKIKKNGYTHMPT